MAGYLEKLKTKKRPPQALQKLQKGESTPAHGTAKTAKSPFYSKCSMGGRHISEKPPEISATIPAPSTPGMGYEYDALWNKAWLLANEIDNPQGALLADRKAKLPELDKMRARMAAIVRQAVPPPLPTPEASPADTWMPWESSATIMDRTSENCSARCRRTGKCYARAYFEGKAGKAKDCEPENCKNS